MLPLDCVTPPPRPVPSRYRYIDRSTGRSILIGFVRRRCDARRRHTREIIHNHRVVWMLGRGEKIMQNIINTHEIIFYEYELSIYVQF